MKKIVNFMLIGCLYVSCAQGYIYTAWDQQDRSVRTVDREDQVPPHEERTPWLPDEEPQRVLDDGWLLVAAKHDFKVKQRKENFKALAAASIFVGSLLAISLLRGNTR